MTHWEVRLTLKAEMQVAAIKDRRVQERLRSSLRRLEYEPELQGKPLTDELTSYRSPLTDELTSYRSVRAVGQRYRIIYKVEEQRVMILVVALGIRKEGDKKDIYELAKKLKRLGLLDQE